MSIIRVSKRKQFLVMDKEGLNDERLTFKATGLLAFLLGKPDDWTISYRDLTHMKADGEHSIRQALKELERFGYLHRMKLQSSDGTWSWEQVLYETPCVENPRSVAVIIPARKIPALTKEGLLSIPPTPAQRGLEDASPRTQGTNPRAKGTNPRAVAKSQADQQLKRIRNCTRCGGSGIIDLEDRTAMRCPECRPAEAVS